MLFSLTSINHDTGKIYEALCYFFTELRKVENTKFSNKLFPDWFRSHGVKGKLHSNFKIFFEDCKKLDQKSLNSLCDAFFQSNRIEEICKNTAAKVYSIDNLPQEVKAIVDRQVTVNKNLFQWLYTYILTSKDSPFLKANNTSLLDHYQKFCDENSSICPFCGLENYNLPENEGSTDYDHYLHKNKYPFSTVNPHNLFPMGSRCNQKVKGTQHIIYSDYNRFKRCIAFYPYSTTHPISKINFNIRCLDAPTSSNKLQGKWEVKITSIKKSDKALRERIKTWNRVFLIEDRYAEEVKRSNRGWIEQLIEDELKLKVQGKQEDEISAILNNCIEARFSNLELTLTKVRLRVNLIPEHLFFKYLQADNSLVKSLLLISLKRPTTVDMSWHN